MSYTISQAKADLTRKLHGSTLNEAIDQYGLFREAAGNVLIKIDPLETIRIQNLSNAIHDQVYDYQLPTDIKTNKVIDIRPQVNREASDSFNQTFSKEFDKLKNNNGFSIRFDDGLKSLRVSKSISPGMITLNTMDSLTTNGTWAASSSASNLAADILTKISSAASLSFDIAVGVAGTTGVITNSTMTAVDLTNVATLGSLFVWVYLPTDYEDNITSIALKWGSTASAYLSKSVTSAADATAFRAGWNLLRFDWNTATATGSADVTGIDYLQLTITTDGTAISGIHVDNITASLGKIFEIEYYSKFLFRSAAGVYKETPTDDTDIVNLDADSYNIFLYESAFLLAQEIQGEDAVFDRNFFYQKLHGDGSLSNPGLYAVYQRQNPSQTEKPRSTYYRMPIKSRR